MNVLCVIPARGGSKGLPGKNLRTVGGISLVGRAIRCAREFLRLASLDGRVVVDTDSPEIAEEGRRWGADVPFLRPAWFAADETPTIESTLHLLDRLGESPEAVVLLQPTSPLRAPDDVVACWRAFHREHAPSVVALTRIDHPIELAVTLGGDSVVRWREAAGREIRRQESSPAWQISGSVYVSTPAVLRERRAFTVPGLTRGVEVARDRSVDVDTLSDLELAEALLADGSTPQLRLGGHRIGGGARCFIIAEAGVNHNGDPALAHRLIEVAADAGVDAVKFQLFDPERLVSAVAPKAEYQINATGGGESQLEMLRGLTLPREVYIELAAHAAERGLTFLTTAFDERSADFLETLDLPAFKVPSGEVTNHPFLAHLARKGRPLLLSTGMSTTAEVGAALAVIREHGDPPLALFHCVTQYPAPPEQCDLRSMETLRRAFGVPVGWSDHTRGLSVSLAAAALGAELLEKHFTLDRSLPGPDHGASLEPNELAELTAAVRQVEASRGEGRKQPAACEAANRDLVRRSLHVKHDLAAGHRLSAEDLVALRPGTGISPTAMKRVLGRVLNSDLASGQPLTWDHVD